MTVNHPQWGTMCEICFEQVTVDTAALDCDGTRWDVHAGDCAQQAGITEHDPIECGCELTPADAPPAYTVRQGGEPCGCQWRIERSHPGVTYSRRCDTHAPMCRSLETWELDLLRWVPDDGHA